MLTPEQARAITFVYKKFIFLEDNQYYDWSPIDDFMLMLEWLDDSQLTIEAESLLNKHKSGNPHCEFDEQKPDTLTPLILESIENILLLFKDLQSLHPKHRFVLEYYLALAQAEQIR